MTQALERRVRQRLLARNEARLLAAQFGHDPALSAIFDDVAHRFDGAIEAAQAELRVAQELRNAAGEGDA